MEPRRPRFGSGAIADLRSALSPRARAPKSPQTPAEDPDLLLARALQEQENMLLMLQGGPTASLVPAAENADDWADAAGAADDAVLAQSLDRRERQALYNKMLEMSGFRATAQQVEEEADVPVATDTMSYEELQMLQEAVGSVGRGLSQQAIAQLPRQPAAAVRAQLPAAADAHLCPICQDEFTDQQLLTLLPCKHPYHSECIEQWLAVNKVCPVCNVGVTDDAYLPEGTSQDAS